MTHGGKMLLLPRRSPCRWKLGDRVLAANAALEADPEGIVHAMALDPLTSAVCTLYEIREMCTEMFEAERPWLPQFEGRVMRSVPAMVLPPHCRPVAVPLDPTLAINKSSASLIEQSTE